MPFRTNVFRHSRRVKVDLARGSQFRLAKAARLFRPASRCRPNERVAFFVPAFRSAKAIAFADPAQGAAGGAHLIKSFASWGIEDELKSKIRATPPGDGLYAGVEQGVVEIGFAPFSETLARKSPLELVGPIPAAIQSCNWFAGGALTESKEFCANYTGRRYLGLRSPALRAKPQTRRLSGSHAKSLSLADCVADEAVGAEPLSVVEFPDKRQFTGNSREKQALVPGSVAKSPLFQMPAS